MLTSEYLENFLNFLAEAETRFHIAQTVQSEKDSQTQDILHRLELADDPDDYRMQLLNALIPIRKERRAAKDEIEILSLIVNWVSQNYKTVNSLKQLLGEVRKLQNKQDNRIYIERTNVVENVFKSIAAEQETPPEEQDTTAAESSEEQKAPATESVEETPNEEQGGALMLVTAESENTSEE